MQNPVAVCTEPFCFCVRDYFFRDLRLVTALMPAFIARVAEDDDVSGRAVLAETVLTKGKLLAATIDFWLDLGVFLHAWA